MALRFAGDGTYTQKSFTFTAGKGTVVLHFVLLSDRNDYSTIVQLCNGDNAQVVIRTGSDGTTLSCYTYNSSVTGLNLTVGRWYSLGVTWDGTDTKVYLDDALVITNPNDGANWTEVRLGASWWGEYLNGAIANVLAWDAIFTQKEIRSQIKRMTPVTFTNLLLWLPTFPDTQMLDSAGSLLNDSDGNPLYDNSESLRDYSGYDNHLQPYGAGAITNYRNPSIPWGGKPGVIPKNNLSKSYSETMALAASSGYAFGGSAAAPSTLTLFSRSNMTLGAKATIENSLALQAALGYSASGVRVFLATLPALSAQLGVTPSIGNTYTDAIDLAVRAEAAQTFQITVNELLAALHAYAAVDAGNITSQQVTFALAADASLLAGNTLVAGTRADLDILLDLTGNVGGASYKAAIALQQVLRLDLATQQAAQSELTFDLRLSFSMTPSAGVDVNVALESLAETSTADKLLALTALDMALVLDLTGATQLDAVAAATLVAQVEAVATAQLAAFNDLPLAAAAGAVAVPLQFLFGQIATEFAAGLSVRHVAYVAATADTACRTLVVSAELRQIQVAADRRVIIVPPERRTVIVPAENRTLAVLPESRLITVAPELRSIVVGPDNRIIIVPPEVREIIVAC